MTRNPWMGLLRRSGNEPPETEVPRPGSGYSLAEGEQRSRSRVDTLGSKWGWFGDVAGRRIQDYAARCVRLAQKTENQADKAVLLQMAETWRRLAEKIEQSSSDGSKSN